MAAGSDAWICALQVTGGLKVLSAINEAICEITAAGLS